MTMAIKLQFSQRDRYRVLIEIHLTPSIYFSQEIVNMRL